ncbi:GspE/PulE family protein [Microcella sp.]|uniref:GspE/PulE family protein n=1 Tax=Microcella sp. TaxID=1913979 RepID=UPI00391A048D
MPSLTEVLIIRGIMPIETIDVMESDPAAEEQVIQSFLESGRLTKSQIASARAEVMGLSFIDLSEYPIDRSAVALVPAAMCRRHRVLPIHQQGEMLTLAMVNPDDVFALDDVRASTHMRIVPVVAELDDLTQAIEKFHRADSEIGELTNVLEEENKTEDLALVAAREADPDDAPIVRFVNLIIGQAIQDHASDIHIEPGEREMRVRYRIDGVLHEMQSAPRNVTNGVISRLKIMSDIDIAERRKPQDGRMSVSHGGRQIDLRVATLPTVYGEKVVMRILDNNATRMGIDQLALLDHNLEMFRASYTKPYGMILVTGPTGSGKSTTLYTTLHAVARPEINVITVEDPVEYRMEGINQVQVNVKAGLTFASALRSILRSDPDVVLLGEIRDKETAQIAVEASLTGHLVLSTLHTNDAPSAITRLTEMDIEPFLVGSALDCVVAQRLARRLCDRCKEQYQGDPGLDITQGLAAAGDGGAQPPAAAPTPITPGADAPSAFPTTLAAAPPPGVSTSTEVSLGGPTLWRPVGCSACSGTGYRGRIALHEVMVVTEEIERLAVARASSTEIARVARSQGMRTLREDGWQKALMGLTSVEEILRVVA